MTIDRECDVIAANDAAWRDVGEIPAKRHWTHRRAYILFAIFLAPLVYSCIVPVAEGVHRADWRLVIPVILLFGIPFILPFVYLFGLFGSIRFVEWFWRVCISPRTDAWLLLKVYIFSIFLLMFLADLGIFCYISPEFLAFMNRYGTWIGDAIEATFGP